MKALGRIAAAVLLCLVGTAALARTTETQKLLSSYVGKEPLRSGIVGMLAVRAGGDTLAQINRRVKMVPASNVKLITTGLALNKLGASWRFRTSIGYAGEILDGVLYGDLYIVGGGDPTLGSKADTAGPVEAVFGAWKALLEQAGIERIEGRIIGDGRWFGRPWSHPSWQAEDLGYNYGAGVSGLNFFENAQTFTVTPGILGQAPSVQPLYPDSPWMSWTVHATTGAERTLNTLYCINSEYGPWGEFFGSFPSDRKTFTFEGSNRFGAWTCAYYFYKFLIDNGMAVSGTYGDISPKGLVRTDLLYSDTGTPAVHRDSLRVIGSTLSPPLDAIVRQTNFESDNFFAESLFATLGLTMRGSSEPSVAAAAEEDMLRGMGLSTLNCCVLSDGSGLSRKNYVSAEFFVKFLRKMLTTKVKGSYLASLPSPGGKGTLKYRMQGAPEELKARIRMKSGSMNGVRCLSGYILPPEGGADEDIIVFSILTNNIAGQSATTAAIIDQIIYTLAQEP